LQKGDIDTDKYPTVDVTLKFDQAGANPISLLGIAFDAKKGGYVSAGEQLTGKLFATFGTLFGPETTSPPDALVVKATLKFHPQGGGPTLDDKQPTNTLTIRWVRAPEAAARPACLPAAPVPARGRTLRHSALTSRGAANEGSAALD
jgi:hypothetical protein